MKNNESGIESIYSNIKRQIDKLPIAGKSKQKILNKVGELKELTVDARQPRIALVGRRGAGKSSLINALFAEKLQYVSSVQAGTGMGKWFSYPSEDHGKIRILDSRGLGESEKPVEETVHQSALDQLQQELEKEQPDVFLFLIKAKEADARIEEDLKELNRLRTFIKEKYQYDVPVICIVTQVDELDPPYYKQLPLDGHPEKAKNIATAVQLMEKRFKENDIPLLNIIPVCTYVDFDEAGEIIYDMRWNIDEVASYLIDSLPNEAKLLTAKAAQAKIAKKKVAQKIIIIMSGIASIIAIEPIPFADMPLLTGLQILTIILVAYISGREITKKTATEFLTAVGANVGIAFAVRESVRSAVKIVPGAGHVLSAAVAGGVTYGIGQAAISYFIDKSNMTQAKKAFEKGKKEYRKETNLDA